MKHYIIIFISIFLFFSCDNKRSERKAYVKHIVNTVTKTREMQYAKNYHLTIIDVTQEEKISTEEFESKIEKIEYIALKCKEPIGDIRKILFHQNKIFILDPSYTKKVFVFDMQGNHLYNIGKKGQGPGEYNEIANIFISDNKLVIKDRMMPFYYKYDINTGQFIEKRNYLIGGSFDNIDNHIVYHCGFGEYSQRIEDNYQIFITSKDDSILYKGFRYYPLQKNSTFSYDALKKNNSELLYIPTLSDTVYSISSKGTYTPKFYIKQDKSIWKKYNEDIPFENIRNKIKKEGYTAVNSSLFETKNYISFGIESKSLREGYEHYIGVYHKYYDKIHNKVFSIKKDTSLEKNNLIGYVKSVYNDYFVGIINSEDISDLNDFIKQQKIIIKNQVLLSAIQDDKTELIITLFKFK